jgi:hypothetical protein
MRRAILSMFLVTSMGCKPGLDRALHGIETGAVALDTVLDQQVEIWDKGVTAQIELCRGHETEAARRECMGWAGEGKKIEPLFDDLVKLQAALFESIEKVRELEKELGPYLEKAKEAAE